MKVTIRKLIFNLCRELSILDNCALYYNINTFKKNVAGL